MYCTYVLWYAKRYLSGRSDIEQQKNQARSLSHYRISYACLKASVSYLFSQSVSQLVENSIK